MQAFLSSFCNLSQKCVKTTSWIGSFNRNRGRNAWACVLGEPIHGLEAWVLGEVCPSTNQREFTVLKCKDYLGHVSYCVILEIIDLGTSYETGEELHLLSVKLSLLLLFSLSDGYLEKLPSIFL